MSTLRSSANSLNRLKTTWLPLRHTVTHTLLLHIVVVVVVAVVMMIMIMMMMMMMMMMVMVAVGEKVAAVMIAATRMLTCHY